MNNFNVFEYVPDARIARSKQKLSYTKDFTGQLGKMYVTMCEETIPGDIFKVGNRADVMFMPMVAPFMDEVKMVTRYFWVANRIVDKEHWEEIFMKRILDENDPTGTKYRELKDSDNIFVPVVCADDGLTHDFKKNTLTDYIYGIVVDNVPKADCPCAYPLKGFNFIWNEFFRDEKIDSPRNLMDESIPRVRWAKDYFTSANLSAQFGDPASLPLSGYAPLTDYLKVVDSGIAEYLEPKMNNDGVIRASAFNGSPEAYSAGITNATIGTMAGNTVVLTNTDTTNQTAGSSFMGWGPDSYIGIQSGSIPSNPGHLNTDGSYVTNWFDSNGNLNTGHHKMFIGNNFSTAELGMSDTVSGETHTAGYTGGETGSPQRKNTNLAFDSAFGGNLNAYLGIFGVKDTDFTGQGTGRLTYTKEIYANRQLPRQLVADLSKAGTFDIADLRLAKQIQMWKERVNVSGLRYVEYLNAQYGVYLRDDRAQRPVYLGSTTSYLNSSSIMQVAGDTDSENPTPIGTRYGNCTGSMHGMIPSFTAKECGYLFGISYITVAPNYQQGLNRQFIKHDFYDFYNQLFTNIGDQEILEKELYLGDNQTNNNRIFGFTGRDNYLRTKQNMICGNMRDTYKQYTMTRVFDDYPNLNSEFLECIPAPNCFAYQSADADHFMCHYTNVINAIRPIPAISTPSL